jgi:hypothetical protein
MHSLHHPRVDMLAEACGWMTFANPWHPHIHPGLNITCCTLRHTLWRGCATHPHTWIDTTYTPCRRDGTCPQHPSLPYTPLTAA